MSESRAQNFDVLQNKRLVYSKLKILQQVKTAMRKNFRSSFTPPQKKISSTPYTTYTSLCACIARQGRACEFLRKPFLHKNSRVFFRGIQAREVLLWRTRSMSSLKSSRKSFKPSAIKAILSIPIPHAAT